MALPNHPLTRALPQNGGGGAAVLQGAQSVMHEPKSYIPGCIISTMAAKLLQNPPLRSIAEYFAKKASLIWQKNCKQFASLIWQKKSLYRADFATFASFKIFKIILNVCSAHYLQMNLFTLTMLAYKLGPSLAFFSMPNFFYL